MVHALALPHTDLVARKKKSKVEHARQLRLLVGDAVSSAVIGFAVTPFVLIIDKAVTEAMSGAAKSVGASIVSSSQTLLRSPVKFVASPSFVVMWAAFGATYIAANALDTLKVDPITLLLGATAANMAACNLKDLAFARMFGVGAPKPMPLSTISLFAVRDAATMAMVFTVPKRVSKWAQNNLDADSGLADNTAQIICPMVVQLASTSLHLAGLDLYNRPMLAAGAVTRSAFLRAQYRPAVTARAFRILPAYGIGGIGNRLLRKRWKDIDTKDRSSLPGGERPEPRPIYFAGTAVNFTEFNLQRMINTELGEVLKGRREKAAAAK